MCGIYGQFKPCHADPALIERMAKRLTHRGPDGCGTYCEGPLAFGAGRLAIIDLSAGVQPIFSEDRRVAVVFNGEIYNYKLLRSELEQRGHVFATHTDTEVIVHGYEAWGKDVLTHLRGMFALCIWDGRNESLLLARDRLGEKPLYYPPVDGGLLFASEIKALFEHPGVARAVDDQALLSYLALGYLPPPQTLFRGIHKLAPGELLSVDRHGIQVEIYWSPAPDTTQPMDYADVVRQLRSMLTGAVEMQLMSDVPIGAFLSGGVDSTTVVAIMRRLLGLPVETFTVGFDFAPGSKGSVKFNADAGFAEQVARRLDTHHHAITIRQDEGLSDLFPYLLYAMDEPVANPTIIPAAYVSALARRSGMPVMLTGNPGDELFLGYDHYRYDQILERYLRIPGLLRQSILTPLLERLPARFGALVKLAQKSRHTDPVYRYLAWLRMIGLDDMPGLLSDQALAEQAEQVVGGHLNPLLSRPRTRHFTDRIAFTSLRLVVAENFNLLFDKMSMLSSVEVRSPFEDYQLVEMALCIPLEHKLRHGDFKVVLKDAVADIVPPEVLARPKWGFTVPSSEWLRTTLRPLVIRFLSPAYVAEVGYFQPKHVSRLVEAHMSRQSYQLWPLWTLLVFHLWHALYIDQTLRLDHQLTASDLIPG